MSSHDESFPQKEYETEDPLIVERSQAAPEALQLEYYLALNRVAVARAHAHITPWEDGVVEDLQAALDYQREFESAHGIEPPHADEIE